MPLPQSYMRAFVFHDRGWDYKKSRLAVNFVDNRVAPPPRTFGVTGGSHLRLDRASDRHSRQTDSFCGGCYGRNGGPILNSQVKCVSAATPKMGDPEHQESGCEP